MQPSADDPYRSLWAVLQIFEVVQGLAATEPVAQLLEICPADLRRLERRVRHVRRAVQLDHHVRLRVGAFDHVQDRLEIDLALSERAIPREMLAAAEVLEVHVDGDREEILDHLRRVGSALLQLADVRRELQVPGVRRLHDRVGFVPAFDGRARVLMKARAEAEVVDGRRVFVQRRHDVRPMLLEVVALALHAVRCEHHEAAAMLLQHRRPSAELRDLILPHRGIDDVHRRVRRHERDPVAGEQLAEGAALVPLLENGGERLEAIEAERGHVPDRRRQVVGTARQRAPDE